MYPLAGYDCIPVTIDIVVDIIHEICSQWYLIASCLGGPAAVAAQGDIDVEQSPASVKMNRVINTWIKSGQDVHWSRLLSALTTVGMGAYASVLEEKLRERLAESGGWFLCSIQCTLIKCMYISKGICPPSSRLEGNAPLLRNLDKVRTSITNGLQVYFSFMFYLCSVQIIH